MIIFGSILITFESSSIFGGSWGSIENWLEPKIKLATTIGKFSLPKYNQIILMTKYLKV